MYRVFPLFRPSFMPQYASEPGAFHGDDLYFMFGEYTFSNGTQEEILLAKSMMRSWGTFARTGQVTRDIHIQNSFFYI